MEHIDIDRVAEPLTGASTETQGGKKVFVKTYGCQMNVYDSQRMTDALAVDGYSATERMEEADLVLLNTCHIREKAAEKVYSELGRIRGIKRERERAGGEMMIGIAGCVAQAEGREIIRRAPIVDLVIGPQTYHRLPGALRKARAGEKVVETDYAVEDKFEHLPQPRRAEIAKRGVTAFLSVQEGCDKFCTFCVVPYTRVSEVSRPVRQIVAEAEKLAAAGVREITLLGQNVNAWHGEGSDGAEWGLGRLLFRLAEIPGVARLRYTTSHPRDMDDELIAAHRDLAELMPYLHLPVQSGSDRILKAMNRRHKAADYLALIDRIRTVQPDIAMSGDFIVGFPARPTRISRRRSNWCGRCAMRRPSPSNIRRVLARQAPNMKGHLPENVKDERLQRLQALLPHRHQQSPKSESHALRCAYRKARPTARTEGRPIAVAAAGHC